MSGNLLKMPVVVRVSVGSKYGAQHSQDWTALVAHIPGLKVYFPITPTTRRVMMNPPCRNRPRRLPREPELYDVGEHFDDGGVPEGYYEIRTASRHPREGTDITIAADGATRSTARSRRRSARPRSTA